MSGASIKVVLCDAIRLSADTMTALLQLVRAAEVPPDAMVLVPMQEIRIRRLLDSVRDLRLPDFSKELKAVRTERLSALERVQLQRHEPRVKPSNPRVTGADIRRFIPRRTR